MIRRLLIPLLLLTVGTLCYGAQQTVNVGSAANDGTGESGRTAFQKVNANFTDLYVPPITTSTGASLAVVTGNLAAIIVRSNSGSAMTDTLPSAVTAANGWHVVIVNADATGADTITPSVGTIGGGASFALTAGQTATIYSDGTNYQVFSGGCASTCAATVTTLAASGAITANGGITDTAGITANAGIIVSGSTLTRSGNQSAAYWGSSGLGFTLPAATYTDTTSSGTVTTISLFSLGIPTLAASSATTYTNAQTVVIAGCPLEGTNVTITACRALDVTGLVTFRSAFTSSGGTLTLNNNAGTAASFIGTGTTTALVTLGGGSNGVVINSNSAGYIKDTALISTGTKFTAAGTGACGTITTTLGGAATGSFLCTGTAGASTATITINGATGLTAPTGWVCAASDATSGVAWATSGAASTTTATISGTIATTSDRVVFTCTGY